MSASDHLPEAPAPTPAPRRLLVILPLLVFGGLSMLLYGRLGSGDPSRIPSPLIGHLVPDFSLPPLPGREATPGSSGGLDSAAQRSGREPLVNV